MAVEGTEHLFADASARLLRRLSPRQRRAEALAAGSFVVAAIALALLHEGTRDADLGTTVALVLSLAVLARIEFPVGSGAAVPTQVVFVPMLFLLPADAVPPLVALAMVLSVVPDFLSGRRHAERVLVAVSDAWFSIGPAVVFAVAGIDGLDWHDAGWWLLAFAAQLGVDFAASATREWLHLGKPPNRQLGELATVWVVDASLAPAGLLAADVSLDQRYAFLLMLPLVAVMVVLARERRVRFQQAVDLSRAYQGTALLLGDVLEDDDHYTGEHSRGVVSLALEIADQLRVDPRVRRLVEFGALLHDVGKIAVPNDIINKAGPLTPAEWDVMRRHTVEGERMLGRLGGDMTEVGRVVRASHERFDGGGYPDGLAGEAIPLAARIVACADAFNAMTTDRSYRTARPRAEALAELRRTAGAQFDPRVVEAAVAALERTGAALPRRAGSESIGR